MTADTDFKSLPPFQTEIKKITGTPEGNVYADYGTIVVDTEGNVYIKQSVPTSKTGWTKVLSS